MTQALSTTESPILTTEDWYESLIVDCDAIITEGVFNSRWTLIQTYHDLGERIRKEKDKAPTTKLVKQVAKDLDVTERNIWYAVQFYDAYPDINQLPEGKNISWSKVKKLLSSGDEEYEQTFDPLAIAIRFVKRYGIEGAQDISRAIVKVILEYAKDGPIEDNIAPTRKRTWVTEIGEKDKQEES